MGEIFRVEFEIQILGRISETVSIKLRKNTEIIYNLTNA